MIEHDRITPEGYARKIASYISDPSTIRIRTLENFGRAPSVQRCAELRRIVTRDTSSDARRMARMRAYNPFPCGHDRTEANTLHRNPTPECKTCRRALEAKAQQQRKQRLARAAANKPVLAVNEKPLITSDIIKAVAAAFNVTRADLLSSARQLHLVCARAVVAKLLRDRGVSFPEISRRLNRSCHSSAINLIETFEARSKQFPEVGRVYKALRG